MLFKRDNLEYEFLPAALEISETPANPLGRFIIWGIFALIIIALLWSYFGMVDEVAVARGKVIPDGRLKVIQPLEEGIVTAIHVAEGQRVKEGELLLELDSTLKQVDVRTLEKSLTTVKLEKEMLMAELSGKSGEEVLGQRNLKLEDLSAEVMAFVKQLKQARESEYRSKEETLKSIIAQRADEIRIGEPALLRLENKYLLLKKQEASLKELAEQGGIPETDWEVKANELSAAEKEYEMQKISNEQSREKLEEARKNLDNLARERETNTLNLIVEKEKNIAEIEAQLVKAQKLYQFQNLLSPVNGTVHGMNANTVGGVVTPAQPIMTIVPDGTPLIIEATVLNKDIGFVKVDQEAEIKFDTFSFQKYGTIKGTVSAISPDAFDEGKA